MYEIETEQEMPIFSRPLTVQQRVANSRNNRRSDFKKTIEIQLSLDEVAILDALASKRGLHRVFLTSLIVKEAILNSGYFISGGSLITPTNYPSGSF